MSSFYFNYGNGEGFVPIPKAEYNRLIRDYIPCKKCGGKGIIEFGTCGSLAEDMYYDSEPCPLCSEEGNYFEE